MLRPGVQRGPSSPARHVPPRRLHVTMHREPGRAVVPLALARTVSMSPSVGDGGKASRQIGNARASGGKSSPTEGYACHARPLLPHHPTRDSRPHHPPRCARDAVPPTVAQRETGTRAPEKDEVGVRGIKCLREHEVWNAEQKRTSLRSRMHDSGS